MTSYQDITRQIGDQWVAALQRAEDAVAGIAQNVADARGKLDVPQVEVPEQLAKLTEALAGQLPKPSEIVAANFELTERLLAAQKALTLRVLEQTSRQGGAAESTETPAAPAATEGVKTPKA